MTIYLARWWVWVLIKGQCVASIGKGILFEVAGERRDNFGIDINVLLGWALSRMLIVDVQVVGLMVVFLMVVGLTYHSYVKWSIHAFVVPT